MSLLLQALRRAEAKAPVSRTPLAAERAAQESLARVEALLGDLGIDGLQAKVLESSIAVAPSSELELDSTTETIESCARSWWTEQAAANTPVDSESGCDATIDADVEIAHAVSAVWWSFDAAADFSGVPAEPAAPAPFESTLETINYRAVESLCEAVGPDAAAEALGSRRTTLDAFPVVERRPPRDVPLTYSRDRLRQLGDVFLQHLATDRFVAGIATAHSGRAACDVVSELAVMLAERGRGEVLVVRGEIPVRGDVDPLWLSGRFGLVDVLAGRVPWNQAVATTVVQGLNVLPFGAARPRESVSTERCKRLWAELQQHFAYVLIVVVGMECSSELLASCDGVFLFVSQGKASAHAVSVAAGRLRQPGVKLLGGVLINPAVQPTKIVPVAH